jgi:hypothetical protein
MDDILQETRNLENIYNTAINILAQTNFYVYQAMEKGVPVDPVMVEYRDAVRQILVECIDSKTVVWPRWPYESEDSTQ